MDKHTEQARDQFNFPRTFKQLEEKADPSCTKCSGRGYTGFYYPVGFKPQADVCKCVVKKMKEEMAKG